MDHDICTLLMKLDSKDANDGSSIVKSIIEHVTKLPVLVPMWSRHIKPKYSINVEYNAMNIEGMCSILHTWYDIHMIHYFDFLLPEHTERFQCLNGNRSKKKSYTYTIRIDGNCLIYFRPLAYITTCLDIFTQNPSTYKVVIDNNIETPCYMIHNYRRMYKTGVNIMSTVECCQSTL